MMMMKFFFILKNNTLLRQNKTTTTQQKRPRISWVPKVFCVVDVPFRKESNPSWDTFINVE